MANEATVTASLSVLKGNINYRSSPTTFLGDITGTAGPTPGLVIATAIGTDLDLSLLNNPGYATIHNISQGHAVDVGIWDGTDSAGLFHPLLEILPGEIYPMRFSRNLTEEYGTGTGTFNAQVNNIRIRSLDPNGGTVNVVVEAFES